MGSQLPRSGEKRRESARVWPAVSPAWSRAELGAQYVFAQKGDEGGPSMGRIEKVLCELRCSMASSLCNLGPMPQFPHLG